MKYLSLIIVLAFLIFTWKISNSKKDLSISEQQKLNEVLGEFVSKAVQEKVPGAKDIQFTKIYTEVLEPGEKMRAHFSFSYTESKNTSEGAETNSDNDDLRRHRKGSFYITSNDGNQWTAKIEKIDDVKIEFVEALDVSKDIPPEESQPKNTNTPPVTDKPKAENVH